MTNAFRDFYSLSKSLDKLFIMILKLFIKALCRAIEMMRVEHIVFITQFEYLLGFQFINPFDK